MTYVPPRRITALAEWLKRPSDQESGSEPSPWPDAIPNPRSPGESEPLQLVKIAPIGRAKIPPRQWAYGNFLIFGYASCLAAIDGGGKGAMATVMATEMITGKSLLHEQVWRSGPVAIITYEDSIEEWHRRIAAACLFYDLDYEAVLDKITFLKKKGGRISLATVDNGRPVMQDGPQIIAALKQLGAVLLIIDPFNHAHEMGDGNNNVLIAKVASEANRIAEEARAAVLVLHHLRKGPTGHVDDIMGAASLRATFRASRVLMRMTPEEGNKLHIQDGAWRYSRIAGSKENFAPKLDQVVWYRLSSVELGNVGVDPVYPDGDNLQVTERWTPPPLFEGLDRTKIAEVFARIRRGPQNGEDFFSPTRQSKNWVGMAVLDVAPDKAKDDAGKIIAQWIKNGILTEGQHHSEKSRKDYTTVVLNEAKAAELVGSLPREEGW